MDKRTRDRPSAALAEAETRLARIAAQHARLVAEIGELRALIDRLGAQPSA